MIGVDIGSEFFKIVVIKPGKPFAVVENLQSKLKTPTAISLKDDEIAYGPDALSKKARFPKNIFTHFENYLGASFNDTFVQEFLKEFLVSYDIEEDERRNTINFNILFNNEKYKVPIELVYGMLFDHIKFISEKFAGIEITDCFVTIPSFFNYKQRNAIAQAIELSKLHLDGFVSETLAAAVQFQLKRKFEENQYYIFYDMGSSYTQASLVEFSEIKDENNTKVIAHKINVLGETWDKKLGGNYFNKNLIKLMMERFDKLPQRVKEKSVKENKKVFEKMHPHSIKIKEILSANKDAHIAVLSVDKGTNLEGAITREEFLEVNEDLLAKVYNPIEELLTKNNLTIQNISGIELLGGSIRIPKVKENLENKLGENKTILGAHMNGDDSMAFGAAYMAANASSNFRGRMRTYMDNGANSELKIYLSNYNVKKDQVYCPEEDNSTGSKKKKVLIPGCIHKLDKSTTLIPFRFPYDSKRSVNLQHDSDIYIKVTEKMVNEENEVEIMNFTLTGVSEFIEKMLKINETFQPKISLKFYYNKGGQLELTAHASYDEVLYLGRINKENETEKIDWSRNFSLPLNQSEIDEIDKILNTSKVISNEDIMKKVEEELKKNHDKYENLTDFDFNFTNVTSSNGTDNTTANDGNKTDDGNSTQAENKTITEDERDALKLKRRIGEAKNNTVKHYLKVDQQYTSPKPLNRSEMYDLRTMIKKFKDIDKNRTKLIEARNTMESLLYSNKEWLESNLSKALANETEYENTKNFVYNLSNWYEEDGFSATYEVLEKEIKGFDKHFKVYHKRYNIYDKRNTALRKLGQELNTSYEKVGKLLGEKKWLEEFVNDTFANVVQTALFDLEEKLKKQDNLTLYEKPIVEERHVNDLINLIHRAYYNLTKIKKPDKNKDADISMQDLLKGSENLEDLIVSSYSI